MTTYRDGPLLSQSRPGSWTHDDFPPRSYVEGEATSQPTDPLMPWPSDTEHFADAGSVNPLMRWHNDAERLADEEKQALQRQARIAHDRWRVESPEGRVATRMLRHRGLRTRREDLIMRSGRAALLLLAYGGLLYLITGGIASGAQRIILAVLISALAAIAVKAMEAIWRRSN